MRCDAIRFDWIIIIIVYPMRLLRTLFDTSLLLIRTGHDSLFCGTLTHHHRFRFLMKLE